MRTALLSVLLAASVGLSAPPDAPKEIKLTGAGLGRVEIAVPEGAEIGFHAAFSDAELFFDELAPKKGKRRFLLQAQPGPDGVTIPAGRYSLTWWTKGETEGTHTTIVVSGKAAPDVVPDPKPKDDKKDVPAKSFRVFLVTETGQAITPGQVAALYGKAVEEYLAARCGSAGWQRRDKDADPAADATAMKDLWAAAKSKIVQTPCVVTDADGVVTVTPLPANAADTLALLKKLAGDK